MFVSELLALLSKNKNYPKYQHERRIDIFLQFFLADIIEAHFGFPVTFVIPEFPLKNPGSSLSTNIDYLVYSRSSNTVFICELKTDHLSFRQRQADRYLKALEDRWEQILNDVVEISRHTSPAFHGKYAFLLGQAKEIPADATLRIVYIAPEEARGRLRDYIKLPDFEFLPLETLKSLNIKTAFPEEWALVRDSL